MNKTSSRPSILASLRALTPNRNLGYDEAIQIAEMQARKLIDLIADPTGIHEHHIDGLPRIAVHRDALEVVSGMSHWNGQQWIITINRDDPLVRQRFTLLHEFKHIIDHGAATRLYRGSSTLTAEQQAERAADYFAGCALVGRRELKSIWGRGVQRAEDLAAHFGVSLQAVQVRLAQTGLDVIADRLPAPRCARPIRTPVGHRQRFRTAYPRRITRSYA